MKFQNSTKDELIEYIKILENKVINKNLRYNQLELNSNNVVFFANYLEALGFAIDYISDFILAIDENSKIVYANQSACNMLEYSVEELSQMSIFDLDVLAKSDVWERMREKLKETKLIKFETIQKTKSGKLVNLEVRANYFEIGGKEFNVSIMTDISEKKHWLSEQEKYKTIFELSPSSIILLNTNGDIIDLSDKIEDYTGFEKNYFIEKNIFELDFFPDYYISILKEKCLRNKHIKNIPEYDVDLKHKSGKIIYARINGSILSNSADNESQVILILNDISLTKQTEVNLQRLHSYYHNLFDQSPDGLVVIDPITHISKEFNMMAHTQLGYTREEFSKLKINDYEAIEDPIETQKHIKKIYDYGFDIFETKHKKKNGELMDVLVKVKLIEVENSHYFYCVFRDITEQKNTQNALLESETLFKTLFENSADPMLIYDETGFIDANSSALKILKYDSVLEFKNAKPEDISPTFQYDGRLSSESVAEKFENAEKFGNYIFEWIHKNKDNESFWVEVQLNPIFLKGKKQYFIVWRDITERKKAEEENKILIEKLLNSERKIKQISDEYEKVFNGSQDSMFLVEVIDDNKFRFIANNYAHQKSTGLSNEFLRGKSPEDFLDEQVSNQLNANYSRCVNSKNVLSYEEVLELPNGKRHWITTLTPVIEDDKVKYIVGSSQDITERKKVEESLRESEAKFKAMASNVPGVIFEWFERKDGNRGYRYISPRCKEFFGVSQEELLSDWTKVKIYHEDLTKWLHSVQNAVENKSEWFFEGRFELQNGEIKWGHGYSSPVSITDDEIVFQGIIVDITNQKKQEEEIFNAYLLKNLMLDSISEGVLLIDKDDNINSYNQLFFDMWELGHFYSEFSQSDVFFELLVPYTINRDEFEEFIQRSRNFPHNLIQGKLYLKNKKVFDFTYKPQKNDGEILGKIWIFRDITEWTETQNKMIWYNQDITMAKLQLEQQTLELERTIKELENAKKIAEESTKAKSMFLANMSHEIRTPMNAILGFAELLSKVLIKPKEKEYINSIQTSGKTLLALINDILDFSKIESGKIELNYEETDIKHITKEVVSIFKISAENKGLDLLTDIDISLPDYVLADEIRIRQILFNLIGNAVKFTQDGFIKVTLKLMKQNFNSNTIDIIFIIQDTGIGIPESAYNRIFEAFLQQDSKLTKKFGGTGLGLSISKKLVELMNGKIWLDSKVGEGTNFYVEINNLQVSKRIYTKTERAEINPKVQFKNQLVLVVDDIETNRKLITEMLSDKVVKIIQAENGQIAIELTKQFKPDLILMDIKMPVMDGIEASTLIKNDENLKNIPLVIITASVLKDNFDDIKKISDGILIKPFSEVSLISELTKYLDYSKIVEEDKSEECCDLSESNNFENIEDLEQLCFKLEHIFIPRIKPLLDYFVIDEIMSFANEIKELGLIHNLQILERQGSMIYDFANNFDVVSVQNAFSVLIDIFEKLKESCKKGIQ